jgi:hypothetical protein
LLAGRVPANVVTVIMDAPRDELECRAFSLPFNQNGEKVDRGVISYYAALTLARAASVKDWLALINEKAGIDVQQKKLTLIRQPKLKMIGDANLLLPGTSTK